MNKYGWLIAACLSATAGANARVEMTDRILIRMSNQMQLAAVTRQAQVQQPLRAGLAAGVTLTHWRHMGLDAEVLKLKQAVPLAEARLIAQRISKQAGVEWAVASQRRYPAAVPNDPEFVAEYKLGDPLIDQTVINDFGLIKHLWYLYPVQTSGDLKTLAMSINWLPAWERSAGFTDRNYASTVAVIDTGIVAHGDLESSRILPGYDFIHDAPTARDNDGRDNNARDEGDWNTTTECDNSDSSWHGTFVAGVIAATADNNLGLSGINPKAKILPVRVLGKCGGWDEDIIDGALWAGGLSLARADLGSAPTNPNPASVVNFSLGGEGACTAAYQSMVDRLRSAGIVVVAAAGNSSLNVSGFSPANCSGVIAVSSNARSGALADYSNFGVGVGISAPGGGTTFKVTSTSNAGKTAATTDTFAQERGTSFSAPMVSAGVSLIRAANPNLTPDSVLRVLQLAATPFPADVDCDVRVCGAGVLNVDNAVSLAASGLSANTSLQQFSASLGSTSATHTIQFTNSGNNLLNLAVPVIQGMTEAKTDFQMQNHCGVTLAPAASCTIEVSFTPSANGGRYAWLELAADNAVARVALFGIAGGDVLSADKTSLQFSAAVGSAALEQQISFTNSSSQSLSFTTAFTTSSTFAINEISCDGVVVNNISDCHLPANKSVALSVVFRPAVVGQVSASMQLSPVEGAVETIPLIGVGTEPPAGGGGCTVLRGQTDLGWLLLLTLIVLWRRRWV